MMRKKLKQRSPLHKSLLWQDEHGSALVMVMFVLLLLTILGVAVLSATVGGAQRTETRENDVQSLHLAQKGLNEAVAYIQSELQGLKLEDVDPQKLDTILSELDENKTSLKVTTELQTTTRSVEGIELVDKKQGEQSIQYIINVYANAVVNGVQRKLSQQIIIDSYPDFLKYVFGSEQTLTLNGTPVLKGNVYAGTKLLVTNTANYSYGGQWHTQNTINYPYIKSNDGGTALGEVHVQSLDSIKYIRNGGAAEQSLPQGEADRGLLLQEILHINSSQIKIKEQKKFVQISVAESFIDKMAQALAEKNEDNLLKNLRTEIRSEYLKGNASLNTWLRNRGSAEHIREIPKEPVKVPPDSEKAVLDQYNSDLQAYNTKREQLERLSATVIFDGNLTIDGLVYQKLYYPVTAGGIDPKGGEFPRWFIVAGDLEINNYTSDFMQIRGNILVTGDVKIKGNVQFNSTMLVLGKTTIEDANIKGIVENKTESNGAVTEETKELVLISKGPILINRLKAFAVNEPDNKEIMEAFFYTDSEGKLYGVGSMFHLIGGFFAKGNLTVNAVVGNVTAPASGTGKLKIDQDKPLQRFVINYKTDIYENQQSSLPRVQSVNVHAGPVQLVNE